jgi:TonB-linked SusC/RagA family outer membrane protein
MTKTAYEQGRNKKLQPPKWLLIMKLTTVLLMLCFLQASARGYGQEKINLQLRKSSLKELLKEVGKQTGYRFVYHNETLSENKKITLDVKNAGINEVLKIAFEGTGLSYTLKEDNLVVIYASGDYGTPEETIKGKVAGSDGKPLAGVSVKIVGTSVGTSTDDNGNYTVSVPNGAKVIEFSLVSYIATKENINGRQAIDVVLQADATALTDVTVTGYTSYKRNRSVSPQATVGADKIAQVPMTVDQILQGRVPGLNVAAGSGQPGQSAKVTIRGVNTITGSTSVLYVLDGIPIENGYFQALNPSDIESITVLKDAAATALYGSRGSNGVVVITSKKGKSGKVVLEYKSQYGVSTQTTPKFTMMNAAEHLLFEEQIGLQTGAAGSGPGWTYSKKNPAYANKTQEQKDRADFILDSLTRINTDWRDIFFRNGKFMEQQVSASGGTENVRFYSSLNYYKQDGIAVRSDLQRFTLKNNLDFKAGKFSANINLTMGFSQSNFIEAEGGSSGNNPLSAVYYALPYEYPYWPDGTLVHPGNRSQYTPLDSREGSQALERLQNTSNKTDQFKNVLGISMNYELMKGLVAKTRLGVDYRQSMDEAFVNPDSYSGSRVSPGNKGSFNEVSRRNFGLVSTSGLTYSKVIDDRHDVEVSGFFEHIYNNYRAFGSTGYGIEGRLPNSPAGTTVSTSFLPSLSGSRTTSALTSFMGLGRYTFDNKYTLNGSYRYDGSSTVPVKNRWKGFYSVGLAWEAKKENFLQDVDFVSALRFRGSYGTTASPFSQDFGYVATFTSTTYGGNQGIRPSAPGNQDYNWEFTKETNVGFDLSLLKSQRVRLSVDVYDKRTNQLFFDRPLSITSGFYSARVNGGVVQNKGIETDLQIDVVKTKNLTWTVGGNFAYNHNEVLSLDGADEFEIGYTGIIREGMPLGTHYAPKWAGVDPATGNPQFYDKEGKITTTYNAAELSVAEFGTYLPAITGGFNTSLAWKGLSVNALFSYNAKVFRYNNEDYYNENPSFRTSNQSTRMLYERWQKPGDNALLQSITTTRRYTSRDIQDASFIRLRNVNVGYNLPASVLGPIKFIKGIQVFAQGQNLYTWTKWRGFDPENGNEYNRFSYPSPRTFTAGLNITFN